MLNNVAAVLLDGVHPFELGVVCEVFGLDRGDEGLPVYDFAVVSAEGPRLRTHAGFDVVAPYDLDRLDEADLIAVPAGDSFTDREFPPELLKALVRAVDRGAWVLSVCSGVFAVAAAGLLDGRRCAAHWRHLELLSRRYPQVRVEPDVLYVEDAGVITSAGTAAGIDACLHLVRREQGTAVANAIARRMVVPPHREGGQAQYVARPLPRATSDTVTGVLSWMERHLDRELTVDELAARAHMSPRTFARRFQQETGTTPYRWLLGQRVLLARELLEGTDHTVDAVAVRAGFGNAATMRHHFTRWTGTTPQAYRRTFRDPECTLSVWTGPRKSRYAPAGSGRPGDTPGSPAAPPTAVSSDSTV
ncbi:GlxA family transcriptional regulator [Actinacidiphila sp. ITFR-21]|uniref:GlxA family transcriptional regulator n=1 Tax=Actinacidiphila sp. ITFR-21 TaxID=3075199 RepID=UPI00288BA4D9|nr:helix-turn-helix domain-containing protein [Streptomyces sp. ITFR-21]WNI17922.1 helix-turn-helix domain-containing protein [Streptomyces sp. ITFR-21]